jgi:NAD(P)-dependent dehydrogenase (short-subunit alcohol dehydrogenase family)
MGAAATRMLVARGLDVLCVDRDAAGLEKLQADLADGPGTAYVRVADLTSASEVEGYVSEAVERWPRIAGAFHIAGWEGSLRRFTEADISEFDEVMAANTRSVWYGMRYLVPLLIAQGGGAIVNTGSYAAIRGGRFTAAYAAAKHAVVGLSRSVAIENASLNIRVNVVAPGTMDTRMAWSMASTISPDDPAAGLKTMTDRIPRGRMATPEDLASVGVWLLLDAPEHLSGQVIPVDGARSAG